MVLLFISFLSDLDNNEKSLKDGRSKNSQPRSYRGSCLLGSGRCQALKRKVGWEKLSWYGIKQHLRESFIPISSGPKSQGFVSH